MMDVQLVAPLTWWQLFCAYSLFKISTCPDRVSPIDIPHLPVVT